jgi:hypothetical protein
MRYIILESDSGDGLGTIELDETSSDENILETLVQAGYLAPPADYYEITDGGLLGDPDDIVVRDETGDPVLTLTQQSKTQDAANDDENEEDDEEIEP